MKKKLLTVALAAVMVVGSAFSTLAATESEITSDGFLSASTTPEKVSGEFSVTYKFHNETMGNENWNNFIVEVKTQDDQADGLTFRADRCGWGFGEYADDLGGDWGPSVVWTDVVPYNWDTFKTDMKDADVAVTISRTGNKIKFDYKVTIAGTTYDINGETPEIAGLEDALQVTLSGDNTKLTNITFTDNKAEGGNNTPAGGEDTTEAPTNAPAGGDNTPATPNTGDATTVGVLLAVAAVSAVVVLKKRTVAE